MPRVRSDWRSEQVADGYLERNGIPVISDVGTRALVRHRRTQGVLRGVLKTADSIPDTDALIVEARAIPKMDGTDLAKVVTVQRVIGWSPAHERGHTHSRQSGASYFGLQRHPPP